MQTGHKLVLFLTFPILLEGCCMGNRHQQKGTGLQDLARRHYRAVEGEIFMMPCLKSVNCHREVVWPRTGEGREGNKQSSFKCGWTFVAEAKHSGKYTCGSDLSYHLEVVDKKHLRCSQPEESSRYLVVGVYGEVPCPGLNCSDNTDVIWYKGNKAISEQQRDSCDENGLLRLCKVSQFDTDVYFCDRQLKEQGAERTLRRAVNVTVVLPDDTEKGPPTIVYPDGNTTEEVQLGQPHTLACRTYFPFEVKFLPKVQWYRHHGDTVENMIPQDMKSQQQKEEPLKEVEVIQRVIIKEVTQQHLDSTYTCIATNTVGNRNVSIKLKEKEKLPSPVGVNLGWIACVLLVAGLGIILHVKWLELKLFYRVHFQHGKYKGEGKQFDVLLSYVWSPSSAEVQSVRFQSGCDIDDEASLSSTDPLSSEWSKAPQRPLEVLLSQVLEDRWGYRLCLLERDVLPGGAYTNDVVLALQRSQMLICLLSADYLSNSDAVFVLESGVQALLQNSTLKLLLIRTNRASASCVPPDPPLPTLVQRALKVLPSLDWTEKSNRAIRNFWRSLRKAMPKDRV